MKLVEVTSNIWGTKFKIHGLAKTVPANLGQVTYKTSLLHLQPRQMTLIMTELRDDFPTGPDPSFNPNIFSEDEEEQQIQKQQTSQAQRRLNDGAPPIAPMSPRPNRFTNRSKNGQQLTRPLEKPKTLSPLAKAESYDDDATSSCDLGEASYVETVRSKPETSNPRPGPSYTSLVAQYSRSSSNSSGQSRHAISPLCCEGSVPTLQSPKNAVAPSDIIFDRPPASGQTTMMSYSSNTDYSNNVVQVKNALMSEQPRTNSHVNPVPLNLNLNLNTERLEAKVAKEKPPKKREMKFIDEETPTTSSAPTVELKMHRTPTVISISPICLPESITRSCSVGYLDSVEMVPSDIALSMLRRETPNKRLILVDRKPNRKNKKHSDDMRRQKLQHKSKSLDSYDLLQTTAKPNAEDEKTMPELHETSENDGSSSDAFDQKSSSRAKKAHTKKPQDTHNSLVSASGCSHKVTISICSTCKGVREYNNCETCDLIRPQQLPIEIDTQNNNSTSNMDDGSILEQAESRPTSGEAAGNINNNNELSKKSYSLSSKKKTEVITSYTDSPLFSRKHRFGNDASTSTNGSSKTPILGRKTDNTFSFVKQLSEARRRKREENANAKAAEASADDQNVEMTPMEPRSSVSLHAQALTTLENIISRLRDLDEGRLTPPSSPQNQRMPRSSPASPAPSKKGKRHQSSSPIRHILNSPLLNRRQRKKQQTESSDEEGQPANGQPETDVSSRQYRDLETFQKAQLRQKVSTIEKL